MPSFTTIKYVKSKSHFLLQARSSDSHLRGVLILIYAEQIGTAKPQVLMYPLNPKVGNSISPLVCVVENESLVPHRRLPYSSPH